MAGRPGDRGGPPSQDFRRGSEQQQAFQYRRGSEAPTQEEKDEEYYDEAMANAERELAEDAEWKRIQENTFTRWVNEHLRQAGTSINDLETDFSNGLKLIALLEVLSGKKMPRHNKKPTFRSQKLENVSIALKFLETEGVHLVNIDSTDITDCKLKLIMGLIWTLILHYSISMPMYDGPELGGPVDDKTPKQRLLGWMQSKIPGVPINNFTSDWQNGIKVGALVDSVAPGLCPDWEDWDPNEPIRNATEAMDLADNWLGVPKLLTPEEIVNPNVDEMSMMTYLSQFPNAKVKENAPLRTKAQASKVRAYGPGLEPTGNVAKAPAKFTVETFGAGDGDLNIAVKGPDGTDYKVDRTYNNDRKKSYSCSYFPDKEGDFVVPITFAGRNIPKSPFNVCVEGFAGDANKVSAAGPGIEPEGVVANKPTNFDIFTEGAGKGKPEVIVLDPHGLKDAIPVKITPSGNEIYNCEYIANQLGVHSVNVFFAGNPIPDSPFGVKVGPASNPSKVYASGRGLQPHGLRAHETVDFKVFTEGAGEGTANVKIIGPGGAITPTTRRNIDPNTIEYKYTPEKDGRYRVMITWAGKEIPRSPFEVNIAPHKSTKIKAFGPGLKGGVVDMPALFTVDTCGETGALGFSIEGPSQAKINCKDNGDGSADVDYTPTAAGEYAVHILCDNEDIPGSPYMAQILPKTDYDPSKVKCFGPGIEGVVQPNIETNFTIDTTKAGKAPLDILFMDDYGEMKPLWKDENGIHDPKDGGIMAVKLIRAKELVKSDLIGKSDPYAVIKHGSQKFTTKVVKNSQDPEWNYEAQVTIPDQGDKAITIELFDSDKIGKDKSLGSISFDASQIVKQKVIEQGWYPLAGVKSGQVLMSADFLPVSPTMARDILRPGLPADGHKNLEVNRPVLEKKSDGIFECTYTPRKTQKQVICVNYGGVAVPGSPFRVTVDDPTDPSKVKVYGKGVEDGNKTGQPVDFTIDCKEAGPGDLAINITDDKRREVPINVKDKGDHTFNVQYNPQKNGVHSISIKYDGRELPQSPIKVNVKTDIDPKKIKVSGMDDDVFVDCTNDFDVDTSALPADVTPNVGCTIKCPDGSNLQNLKVDNPGTDGKSKVSYTPTQEGKHDINVTCDGSPIHGSPFKVKAKKGCDPSKVKAYGPGLEKGICHEPNQFTIETRNAGTGGLGLLIEGPAEAKMTCKDNRDGSCTVDYVPTEEGNYDITVKFEEKDIPGSPFNVPVVDLSAKKMILGKDNPLSGIEGIPDGKLHINVIKAKELIKADMVGKSDPYAVIKYGKQKFKTPTQKNTQEPKWEYELDFDIPEGDLREVNIEVFDSDKIGKDKSLGKVNIDIAELASINESEGRWYSLTGVKSGKILLSADFLELATQQSVDPTQALNRGDSFGSPASTKSKLPLHGKLPEGKVCVNLVKAKDLIKSDLVGKSDPYAVLKYATQKYKTPTEKNTQEPKWDYHANFDVPEGDNRNVSIEVFDSDKFGKDKSLGKVAIDLAELVNNNDEEGCWYPLVGVKSGKVLLHADFLEAGTYDPADATGALKSLKSEDPKLAGGKMLEADDLPDGKLRVNLIKAKELIKADVMGKSDPYAILKYGNQKFKTKTVKNSLEPLWNHEVIFDIPEGNCKNVIIEVFDADKLGKDKSIGKLDLQVAELVNIEGQEGKWFPLSGVKSGQVLLSADLLDALGYNANGVPSSMLGRKDSDLLQSRDNNYGDPTGVELPHGKARIHVIKAKELIKSDMIGKSDPYVVLSYGKQNQKTKVVKNTQEPQWNHDAEFNIPDGDSRTFNLEVFDSDKIGKDKSLGKLNLDITDVLSMDGQDGKWFPLSGVKSGKILLSADFLDDLGRKASDILPSLLKGGDPNDPYGNGGRRGSTDPYGLDGRRGSTDPYGLDGRRGSTDPSAVDGRRGSVDPYGVDGRRDSTNPYGVDGRKDSTNPSAVDGRRDSTNPYGNDGRKGSADPSKKADLGDNMDDVDLPSGKARINLIKAKDLIKSDLIGKSDPYAVLSYGRQEQKTNVIKNTQEPQWNYQAEFNVPDGNHRTFHVEVFDSDKVGKDKSLGKLDLDIIDVLSMDGQEGKWFPLAGVKSGKVLLSADFLDDLGRKARDILPSLLAGGDPKDLYGLSGRKDSGDPLNKSGIGGNGQSLKVPEGLARINLIKAKELIKSDIGKTHPYAVLIYGKQIQKTKIVKNTLEPEWNHEAEFKTPDGDCRNFHIEVFDSNKDQKDTSLGKLSLDIIDILKMDETEGKWFPLSGVKSGKVLLSADFLDKLGRDPSDLVPELMKGGNVNDPKNRKNSTDPYKTYPSALHGNVPGGNIPKGKAKLKLIKAKELIQADTNSKSDPYAMLFYGKQVEKTKVIQNCHEPVWNHEAEFDVPDGDARSFYIEVFDSDKVGKDETLGNLTLDITDVLSMDGKEGQWFPLQGVKSGKVLLSADFLDELGRNADEILPGLLKGEIPRDYDGEYGPTSYNDPSNKSKKKSGLGGDLQDNIIPKGLAKINIIKAKDLIKSDMIGKSDPYAVLSYGKQKQKTKVVKNTQEPQWNHEAEFNVPDGNSRTFNVEVFDSDKIGKDKSLGKLDLDITDVLSMDGQEGKWFPLSGVKSGKVLLSADFLDDLGRKASDILPSLLKGGDPNDPYGADRKSSKPGEQTRDPLSRAGQKNSNDPSNKSDLARDGQIAELPEGVARINLIKAKELVKADMIGKSDPYAVLVYGKQLQKTKTIKNTLEPEWNHEAEFKVPDGDSRNFYIEVFDSDKVGKDKSLGKLNLDITDVIDLNGKEGKWFPLSGVKTGKVLLSADFIDKLGRNPSDLLPTLEKGGLTSDPFNRRGSTDPSKTHPSELHGNLPDGLLPKGKAKLNLIKAKDLIQADKMSKSDPYAVLLYGKQVEKTKVIPNSHEPLWNHEAEFDVPDGNDRSFYIEVFDSDKVGKDESLGNLTLDIADVLAMDGKEGQWFPLKGVKSGKVLLSASFLDELGRKASDILPGVLRGEVKDPSQRGESANPNYKHPSALHGDVPGADLPSGKAKLKLVRAKELIQADKNSKSDPYAVLVYGRQVEKTKVIQNCHEPEWNHEAEFYVPDGDERCFYIQVFDSDKVGKDTSLGSLSLDITDVLAMHGQKGKWFPLSGVKSGKVLLSADFIDDLGRKPSDILPGLLKGVDSNGFGSRKSSSDSPRDNQLNSNLPSGKAKLNLIKAKDLVKADLIGKSDPYAILKYGKQLQKTKTIKNTLEPQWNHEAEFDVPDGTSRNFYIEVFDSDKIGKDKSLGKLNLDIADILLMDGQEGKWFPLTGVKSGQLLLSADFLDDLGRNTGDVLADLQKSDNLDDPDSVYGRKNSADALGIGGDIGEKPSIMKKRGSVDPKNISGRNDLKEDLPEGKVVMTLVKAKDLIKSDLIGKSDPYAMLTYGLQQHKTPVAKNTQDPVWNHEASFLIPDGTDQTVNIEVFDSDKIGKDKSLGKLSLDLDNVVAMDGQEGRWFPLAGAKSGQILLMSDFVDKFGNDSRGLPSALANKDSTLDASKNNLKDPSSPFNKYGSPDCNSGVPVGKARFNIIRAKDLIKTDLVGKSDPYAVMKYGSQKNKTPVVKNSQNPEWNHEVDFEIPDGNDRTFSVEVFDSDKLGKDKSMGRLDLDIADVEDMADTEGQEGRWYPLNGVKSGQILLSSEILEQVGQAGKRMPSSGLVRNKSYDPLESGPKKSVGDQGLKDGKARVNLIKAKDLISTDITGKSDPYAVIKYGTQKYKTPTVKNTLEPQWDCEVEFEVPEGDSKRFNIEVFDHDKIGKDKSLGKLEMDIQDLGNMDKDSGYWFPLTGVKSGQVLLTGEILDGLEEDDRVRGKSLSGHGSSSPSKRGSVIGGVPADFADQLPEGQVNINLIKAKDLIKADMIGKSDPYAVLTFGSQKYKTHKEKNTQNPEWNYEAKFDVPDGSDQTVNIEIFDSDKIGRDKSLGKLDIDVQDVLNSDGVDAKWYPLSGVKSGQVLLTSDFLQPGSGGISIPDGIKRGRGSVDPAAEKASKSKSLSGKEGGIPDGKVHLELIKAKDLENADKKGKSDPYAVLKYGNQKMKTNTIRNTQNPQWDFAADFDVPNGSDTDINIEVYDNDKLGRDKSLGKLDLDIEEIINNDGVEGKWYPLKGAKSGQILISSDFLPPGSDSSITSGMPSKAIGGKGSGAADPSKVKAFGPGIEKGKVLPGKPASFSVDSSKTGPAPIEVEIEADGKVSSRKPSIAQAAPGLHDVTYVPPPVGQPYQIGVKYGGEDIPGSPFEMSSNPDLDDVTGSGVAGHQNGKSGVQDRKESKIGVSVNPDAQNLGKIHVGLIAAKDLIKTDLVGKSDPYAILSHGNQKFKTNTVKNTQNPEWNYDADFNVPDDGDNTIKIDLFDSDKFGKDKSLGSAILDVDDVMGKGIVPPGWYPLKGVKSGQVLMSADFDAIGSSRLTSPERSLYGIDDSRDPSAPKSGAGGGKGLKNRLASRDQLGNESDDLPEGMLHLDLLAAKNLVKADMIGKSDPYAVLKLGDQAFKTDTVKNSQNPEWNYGADFIVDSNAPSDIMLNVFDQDKFGKDKSLGSAMLPISDLIDRSLDPNASPTWVPLTGVKSGEVLVDTNFVPNDDMDMSRRMSGHGKGKQNLGDPNAKGLAALKNKGSSGSMLGGDLDDIPEGNVHVNLVKAKNLMKSDMIGKSDPYGVISCGNDKSKTKTIKNEQNPEFNHEAYFPVDKNGPRNIKIELLDADKFGSDKPLGSANIDISDLANQGPISEKWLPLKNGKSGEVMVSADFQPKFDDDFDDNPGSGVPGSLGTKKEGGGGKGLRDKLKDKKSQGRPGDFILEDMQPGNLHLDLIQAKDLIKSDMIGKSDPYAVVSFDNEKLKTKTVKNNQNPEWNFDVDIPIDADGPRKINIDVYDKDKIGKDKPLGSASIDIAGLQKGNDLDKEWIPLDGVKTGKIQVSTDFVPESELAMRKTSGLGDVGSSLKSRKDSDISVDGFSPNSKKNRKESDMSVDGYGPTSGKQSGIESRYDSEIPAGNIHLNIHEGKDLVNTDLIGKSDPYAVVTYGKDKDKTKTIKNNLNPEWDFETDIPVEENGPSNVKIEVFDSDKIGKDKPLGSALINVGDLLNEPLEESWIPLSGTKSGKIKVSADFSPDDRYGTVRRPSEQGSRKASESYDMRKISESHSTYSRKTSEMSESHTSYSRKSSEVFASRKASESTYSRKTSGVGESTNDIQGPGTINVNVIQAKDLIKADMIGKSDPYAVISYGNDKVKSKAVKNSQNPEWNFTAQLPVDEGTPDSFKIEVFDKDKFGKDKSLGSTDIDVANIATEQPLQEAWIPLDGVKSGQIQVSTDYEPSDSYSEIDRKTSGAGGAKALKGNLGDGKRVGSPRSDDSTPRNDGNMPRDSFDRSSKKQSGLGSDVDIPPGNLHLEIIEAKNLIKADMIGKSDPYAVVTYGDDKLKTKTIKNDQNPKWNFEADIPTDPNGPSNVKIEIFDNDKFGKDKSLGAANVDLEDLYNNGALRDAWIPLEGVKSGELKISADLDTDGGDNGDPNTRIGSPGENERLHGSKPMQKAGSKQYIGTNEADIPYGNLHLEINQAKDLVKADIMGKSDPYAVVTYGDDKVKTKTVKNNQNPQWGFETDIPIDPNGPSNLKIEVFDDDKLGKDKPLGAAIIDIPSILNDGSLEDAWIPLSGAKSGQIQVSADFDPSDLNDSRNNRKPSGSGGAKKLKGQLGARKQSGGHEGSNDEEPLGNVHLEIIQAKDLIKADLIGKSDPYAVVTYGDDKIKTKTIKNNLNPQWNFEADIPIDPSGPSTLKIEVFDDDKLGKDKPLGAADVDIPSLMNNATLKEAWIPLSGVKSGQLQLSADYVPIDSDGYENVGKPSEKILPKPARDGMRNRGGSPGNDDDFGSLPNQRKPSDNNLAPGNIHLNIVQAKDLIKADMIGKSDPFAVVTYGNDQIKTQTVKNNQNPEWNFEADIPYNPNYSDTLKIEIFDDDKLGKNKLLGTSYIDIPNIVNNEPLDNVWIPLSGVKSGQLQVSADFVPAEFHEYENVQPDQFKKMSPLRDSGALGAPRSAKSPESDKLGKIKLDLLMAKDLIKTDMVGKSDPYAIITHGSQKFKTDIKKNTQNPEFNIQCEVEVPDSNDRHISIDLYDADKFGKDTFLGNLNLDIARVMNLGKLDENWYPLEGVKQGQICVGADFVPESDESSTIIINQKFTESRRTSTQFHEVNLNRIPLPSTGGSIEASIRTPTGKVDTPIIQDDNNGTVAVKYQPTEEGIHYLDVKYNGDQVQGSPFKFHVNRQNNGKASAYGPGLMHGVCGEPANFTVSTKGAGAGGLNLAVEGPSKADISCQDNKDGTVNVSYLPTAPGEYKITAKFAEEHIPGSPFTCKITGEGKKRNQISVGSSSELQLPGNLSESDLRSLKAYIESPSGGVEQCFLKKLPRGNIGISFTPREIGEHLVSVQRNGKHITNSPFKIVVNAQEVGDASRVKVSGDGLVQGKTHVNNRFMINTKSAGYGGLSLSIEGPSKAEIDCKDNENGTLDVDYKPTEPGFYIINIKFADSHVPGSPFQVPISGEGTEKQTENIKRMREAVPVTEVGSQCRLTFKMPGIFMQDLEAMVTSPSGKSTKANVSELEEGLYAVNFIPHELGIHTVTVRYREMDIPGSPFQFTVGPLQDSGAHRVHAGGPGLARGVEGEPADFNVWTREAGPGSLAISVEGPSKAQIDFKDRKDGSCYVSYVVEEPGEYSVGIRFNDEHIPNSPYKVFIIPKSDHAEKVKISNLDDEQIVLNAPQSFLLSKNGASGSLQCKMVSPSGREDDCFMSQVGPDEYSVRFVPKEEGHHYLHAKLNGVHVPGSPFKIKVGGDGKKDGAVKVFGQGLDRVKTGEKASFVIDTSNVGAGTLSVTVDGPSKVDMDCNEVEKGYEVSYMPLVPGDYFVTVKYNGKNVDGSPFKVTATGGGAPGAKGHLLSRRESSSVTMETIQRTMIRQESSMFKESSSTLSSSRSSSRAIAIQPNFVSDASAVTCKGQGIERPVLGKQNSFTVDCTRGGNNVLFVGVFGPETPCDEVYVKHQGDRQYGVSYKLTDKGQYILYVKWGDDHIPGSPFHIEV